MQNDDGHYYTGNARTESNGTLVITVTDGKGDTFSGHAKLNDEGGYDLHLKNPVSGVQANGELEAS